MPFTQNEITQDELCHGWTEQQVGSSNSFDFIFDYSNQFDALDDIFTQGNNLDNLWPPDPNSDPWGGDNQRLKQMSTVGGIEGYDGDGQLGSRLSSSSVSSLSTPYIAGDCTSLIDIPLKNVEENGSQWEHVEDIALELNSDEDLRRHSLDSLRTGPAPSVNQEAINNRSKSATHAELLKPRRRRGRKPSNLSPEEKRRRRLERGRLAANKCRRKKRELENMLEDRAKTLLAERNTMLKINNDLRIEMQGLIEEVMNHSNAACGGISEAADLLACTPELTIPSQSQKVAGLEQTFAGLCPPQPSKLNSPCLSKTIATFPLDTFHLDASSQNEMMEILFSGQP